MKLRDRINEKKNYGYIFVYSKRGSTETRRIGKEFSVFENLEQGPYALPAIVRVTAAKLIQSD